MIFEPRKGRDAGRLIALLGATALALGLAAVVPAFAGDDDEESSSWTDRMGDSVKNTFEGWGKTVGFNKPAPPPVPESPSGCPSISVLEGTEAQRVMASEKTGNEGLRYQYSIYDVGRSCSTAGGRIGVKIAATGRVLLGPAGAPGHFDVPIRVAIFSLVDQKPVESKLYKVSVSIPGGQAAQAFEFASDNLAVPVSGGRTAADYVIKVGIDGGGKAAAPTAKGKKRGPKPMQSASQQ